MQPTILIIEDEKPLRGFLRASLKTQGYDVLEVETGGAGLALAASHLPDLVVLDLGLPDMDGLEVIRGIREWSQMPVIILSARDQERDKVSALDLGADDYLTKPFGVGELLARIRASIRRSSLIRQDGENALPVYDVNGLRIDAEKHLVSVEGEEVHVTPMEFKLLTVMARHAGKVLTHNFLLREVWGPSSGNETQYLRVFMANLRRKLEKDPARPLYLRTEVGVGYRLVGE